jgi:hypothetical protein
VTGAGMTKRNAKGEEHRQLNDKRGDGVERRGGDKQYRVACMVCAVRVHLQYIARARLLPLNS